MSVGVFFNEGVTVQFVRQKCDPGYASRSSSTTSASPSLPTALSATSLISTCLTLSVLCSSSIFLQTGSVTFQVCVDASVVRSTHQGETEESRDQCHDTSIVNIKISGEEVAAENVMVEKAVAHKNEFREVIKKIHYLKNTMKDTMKGI